MDEASRTVLIDHYALIHGTFALALPPDPTHQEVRIDLFAAPDQPLKDVWLSFKEDTNSGVGRIVNFDTRLVVNLPPSRYADIYSMLQTEKPIYIEYRVRSDGKNLTHFYLKTTEEPVGEGLTDPSSTT